jgi:hypothetical protein
VSGTVEKTKNYGAPKGTASSYAFDRERAFPAGRANRNPCEHSYGTIRPLPAFESGAVIVRGHVARWYWEKPYLTRRKARRISAAGSSYNLALSYSRGTLRSDYHRRWRS